MVNDSKNEPRYATGSEQRKIAGGGKRLPGGVLSPEAGDALNYLSATGYASSLVKAIERALIEARDRHKN